MSHNQQWSDYSESLAFNGTDAIREGNFSKAERYLLEALSEDSHCAFAYNGLIILYSLMDDLEKVIYYFNLAQQYAPEDVQILFNFAQVLIDYEYYQEAIPYLEQLVELNPFDSDALCNLGVCVAATGEVSLAIEIYNQALNMAPNDPDIKINLARHYANVGDFQKAIEYAQESLKSYDSEIFQATYLYEMDELEGMPQDMLLDDLVERKRNAEGLLQRGLTATKGTVARSS